MKNMKYILFILSIPILMLNSCTKCSNDNNTKAKKDSAVAIQNKKTKSSKQKFTSKFPAVKKIENKSYESTEIPLNFPGKILPPKELQNYLPKTISGTKKSPPSIGIIYGKSEDVSTVSCTFDFPKGGLSMRITDFGNINNIPKYDLKYFYELPSAPGMEIQTIINDIGKGYVIWNVEKNSGEMYYLLANRFIIRLEGFSLPRGTGGLVTFFDKIDKNKLIKRISNN